MYPRVATKVRQRRIVANVEIVDEDVDCVNSAIFPSVDDSIEHLLGAQVVLSKINAGGVEVGEVVRIQFWCEALTFTSECASDKNNVVRRHSAHGTPPHVAPVGTSAQAEHSCSPVYLGELKRVERRGFRSIRSSASRATRVRTRAPATLGQDGAMSTPRNRALPPLRSSSSRFRGDPA